MTRVTVVPTQPIKTLNLLRSERTVYAISNSCMETKQAVLPLSAPVSTSMLLYFGNRHNHITVFDETIFVSSMTLYQQAMQTYIHLLILRCKILVGSTQTLELHPVDAGCAIASLNSSVAIQGRKHLVINAVVVIHLRQNLLPSAFYSFPSRCAQWEWTDRPVHRR